MSELDLAEYKKQYNYLATAAIARDKVIEKYVKQLLELQAENDSGDLLIKTLYRQVQEEKAKKEIRLDRFNGNLVFLTLRPKPDVPFTLFDEVVKKIFYKKWIKRAVYVIEQVGETDETAGEGFHMHAIIFRDGKKFHEIVNEMLSTTKSIVVAHKKEPHNKQQINSGPLHIVVRPHTVENNDRIHNYLLGWKDPHEKHQKQRIDIIFREKNNLKSHYKVGEWDESTTLNSEM